VDAITQQKNEMKVVIVNQERCIGCGKCINACPFGAMLFNKMAKKAYKCELCGGTPACAAICPVEAILFMNQKPFYSKGTALEMEGFTILSQRQKGSIRQPPKSSR
jgi:Fe-S-cluster-containing hydrogenase component 2